MRELLVLMPSAVTDVIIRSEAPWGWLGLTVDPTEGLAIVTGYSAEDGPRNNTLGSVFVREHYMSRYGTGGWQGAWYRVRPEARGMWRALSRQNASIDPAALESVVQGWRQPAADAAMIVLTVDVEDGVRLSRLGR